jgi:ketosteroid isomerase-like protein
MPISSHDDAVEDALDALRKAILTQDKAQLENLSADQLSYGHSTALVQDKAAFIDGVMTRPETIRSIAFTEVKTGFSGDAAIVRHLWHSEVEQDGTPQSIRIGVLTVWQKQGGDWKLLARQAYRLPGA